MINKNYLAVDIGGTSAKYAFVDEFGKISGKGSFATGSQITAEVLLQNILHLAQNAQISGMGISTLGIVEQKSGKILGGVENMPCLCGLSLKSLLEKALPHLKINIINDAKAAALGEKWQGSAKGCSNFVCIAFGTGIGGCIVLNGKPVYGAHNRAGEVGYLNYKNPNDCFEQRFSAINLMQNASKALNTQIDGVRFFELLRQGNAQCTKIFNEWVNAAASNLANISILLDIEKIIIGGGISAEGEAVSKPLQKAFDSMMPKDFAGECTIHTATLGNNAALLGAVFPLINCNS